MSHVPFLQGAFLGMLAELRVASAAATTDHLAAYAQEPPERLALAGEFLDGMMASCRTSLLLGADHLVGAIDELLRAADDDAFLTMLPRLRAAFERVHERQRQTLADRVARRLGLKDSAPVTRLGSSVETAVLIARLDAETARILGEWNL